MGRRFSQNQGKPGGTGVPPVHARVANLCHRGDGSVKRLKTPSPLIPLSFILVPDFPPSRSQALRGPGELCVQAELGLQIAFPSATWEREQRDHRHLACDSQAGRLCSRFMGWGEGVGPHQPLAPSPTRIFPEQKTESRGFCKKVHFVILSEVKDLNLMKIQDSSLRSE
jgi:hypothetical protein